MIDFIVDNYIWFIVGGGVLLMTIIGYVAEKTDFGRKKPAKAKKKEETKQEESTGIVEAPLLAGAAGVTLADQGGLFDSQAENVSLSEPIVSDIALDNLDLEVDISNANEVSNSLDEEVTVSNSEWDNFSEPVIRTEDLSGEEVLHSSVESFPVIEEEGLHTSVLETNENIDQVVEPIIETENITVLETPEIDPATVEVELPNLEEVKNKEEEDLWKF